MSQSEAISSGIQVIVNLDNLQKFHDEGSNFEYTTITCPAGKHAHHTEPKEHVFLAPYEDGSVTPMTQGIQFLQVACGDTMYSAANPWCDHDLVEPVAEIIMETDEEEAGYPSSDHREMFTWGEPSDDQGKDGMMAYSNTVPTTSENWRQSARDVAYYTATVNPRDALLEVIRRQTTPQGIAGNNDGSAAANVPLEVDSSANLPEAVRGFVTEPAKVSVASLWGPTSPGGHQNTVRIPWLTSSPISGSIPITLDSLPNQQPLMMISDSSRGLPSVVAIQTARVARHVILTVGANKRLVRLLRQGSKIGKSLSRRSSGDRDEVVSAPSKSFPESQSSEVEHELGHTVSSELARSSMEVSPDMTHQDTIVTGMSEPSAEKQEAQDEVLLEETPKLETSEPHSESS